MATSSNEEVVKITYTGAGWSGLTVSRARKIRKSRRSSVTDLKLLLNTGAGWSSLVARRAHNPKVVGSNPAPATKF